MLRVGMHSVQIQKHQAPTINRLLTKAVFTQSSVPTQSIGTRTTYAFSRIKFFSFFISCAQLKNSITKTNTHHCA